MNKKVFLSAVIVILVSFLAMYYLNYQADNSKKELIPSVKKENISTKKLSVDGMTCLGCEVTLEKAVSKVDGVLHVKASFSDKSVEIEYDKTKTDSNELKGAILKKGYKLP